jgi:ribosomal protein L11 methyltransferase
MDYLQLTCAITSDQPDLACEILIRDLAELGFESFEELPEAIIAYIPQKDFNNSVSNSLPDTILNLGKVKYTSVIIKAQNWNETWEKNFQPVVIADKCYVRATFHEKRYDLPYEIVIEPKMAFGTGHHETTSLMITQMLSIDFADKHVLDMGCGTGILSIMASMLNALDILAVDIDEWAYQSTIENCLFNHIHNVTSAQGDIEIVNHKHFDIVLANINRNILLDQLFHYSNILSPGGLLLLSGIYNSDLAVIQKAADMNGFENVRLLEKNNWISVLFTKK